MFTATRRLDVRSGDRIPDRQGGAHGPLRIVLVDDRRTEDRNDGVADELLDRAAVRSSSRRTRA